MVLEESRNQQKGLICRVVWAGVFGKDLKSGNKKHVIKETSEGSGGEGQRGLSWVLVGMFLSWKFCHPEASRSWPINAWVVCVV